MAAQALAVNGAKVYIVGRTAEKLETVVETYGKNIAGKIIASTADVSKKDSIAKLYEEISSKENHIDVCHSCPPGTNARAACHGVVMVITDSLHRS
jgi:NADP-dependent 3-hydroxy acid dehydrogenase YdfG